METIDRRISRETNDIRLVGIYATDEGTRLRVQIRRNFYPYQSNAVVERWDGSTWQEVAQLPHTDMDSVKASPYGHPDVLDEALRSDEMELLLIAARVLDINHTDLLGI